MDEERDIITRAELALQQENATLLAQLGAAANEAAQEYLFAEERMQRAPRTVARHDDDLDCFVRYICEAAKIPPPERDANGKLPHNPLTTTAAAWTGVTWGLLKGFGVWLLQQGYSMSSINGRMATVRLYALWASMAGAIKSEDSMLIQAVKGYNQKAAYNIDRGREVTRIGAKKAKFHVISPDEAKRLRAQPDTPQGRRDAVLISMLIDHEGVQGFCTNGPAPVAGFGGMCITSLW